MPRMTKWAWTDRGNCVEHAVRNLAGSDADGQDDAALRVADALDRRRSDGDVSGPGALEGNFIALLVAGRDLDAIWRTARNVADGALAAQIAEIPDAIFHAADDWPVNVNVGWHPKKKLDL